MQSSNNPIGQDNSIQPPAADPHAIRIICEELYAEGMATFALAKQTAIKTLYLKAIQQIYDAYAMFLNLNNSGYITPADHINLTNCLKDFIDARMELGNLAFNEGDYALAMNHLRGGLYTYNVNAGPDMPFSGVKPTGLPAAIDEVVFKKWMSYHPQLLTLKKMQGTEDQPNVYGDDQNTIFHFKQIPNNGVSADNKSGSCGFISIGVSATDMRKLVQDAKDHDLERVSVFISNQMLNDYMPPSEIASRQKINLDENYCDEFEALFHYHTEALIECNDAIANYIDSYKEIFTQKCYTIKNIIEQLQTYQLGMASEIEYLQNIQQKVQSAENAYLSYLKQPHIIQNHLLREIGNGWLGMNMLLAWATLADRNLKIWKETPEGFLSILSSVNASQVADQEDIHIVHTSNRTHFERLKLLMVKPVVYSITASSSSSSEEKISTTVMRKKYSDQAKELRAVLNQAKKAFSISANQSACKLIELNALLKETSHPVIVDRVTTEINNLLQECEHLFAAEITQLVKNYLNTSNGFEIFLSLFAESNCVEVFRYEYLKNLMHIIENLMNERTAKALREITQISSLHQNMLLAVMTDGSEKELAVIHAILKMIEDARLFVPVEIHKPSSQPEDILSMNTSSASTLDLSDTNEVKIEELPNSFSLSLFQSTQTPNNFFPSAFNSTNLTREENDCETDEQNDCEADQQICPWRNP